MNESSGETPATRLRGAARRLNRDPRLVEMARRARLRALGGERSVDRPPADRVRPSDVVARSLVAFSGDPPGVLGEVGLTTLQAWQRLAESRDRGRGQADVAILFTDLAGFSSWALSAGDGPALRLLREVGKAVEPPILERRGEVVKRLGDGLMAAFGSASSAVEAAFVVNERISLIEAEDYRPRLRTGIHLGRPRKLRGDYFGVDVNIAARLAEAAKPGEVLASDHTLEALDPGAAKARKRRFSAKGVPSGLSAYALAASG